MSAKKRVAVNMWLDSELNERAKALALKTGLSKTKVIEIALRSFLDAMEKYSEDKKECEGEIA